MTDTSPKRSLDAFLKIAESVAPEQLDDALTQAAGDNPDLAAELHKMAERWRIFSALETEGGTPEPSDRRAEAEALLEQLARDCGDGKRYEPGVPIGSGGMADVLRTWDAALRRNLAMKRLRPRGAGSGPAPDELRRFVSEAELMAQLAHPSVVPVHDLGIDPSGQVFFTMEEVHGLTLQEVNVRIHAGDPEWTLEGALRSLLAVCQALTHAHSRGIVHRDLKPANIMVGPHGETYVMDWGIAHREGTADPHDLRLEEPAGDKLETPGLTTLDGVAIGTPAYLAPEHAHGELERIGPATDVYAIGCILYTLLCGSPPYLEPGAPASTQEVLRRLRKGPPERIEALAPAAPPELVSIAEHAMARDPEQRFESMGKLAEELRAFLEGRVVTSHRTGPLVELTKWARRNKLSASLAALLTLALVSLAVGALVGNTNLRRLMGERTEARLALQGKVAVSETLLAQGALDRYGFAEARRRLEGIDERWRGWEWHHLWARLDPAALVLEAHAAPIYALELSEDAQLVLSGDTSGRVVAWDAETLDERFRLELGVPLRSMALFHDGTRLAVGLADGSVELLGLPDGVLLDRTEPAGRELIALEVDDSGRWLVGTLGKYPLTAYITGATTRVWSVENDRLHLEQTISTDKEYKAIALGFVPGTTEILQKQSARPDIPEELLDESQLRNMATIDLGAGTPSLHVGMHRERILDIAFDRLGEHVALTSWDGVLSVWDTGTEDQLWMHGASLPGDNSYRGYCIQFGPDGKLLASGGDDLAVQLRRTSDGQLVRFLPGPTDTISGIVFLPDGKRLMSASVDGSLRVYDLTDPGPILDLPHPFWVQSLAVSPDSKLLATACRDGVLRTFDLETGELLTQDVAAEGNPRRTFDQPRYPWGIAWSPDGQQLASADPRTAPPKPHQDQIHIRRTGQHEILVRTEPTSDIMRLWFSKDGTRISGSDRKAKLRTWDARTGELLSTIGGDGSDAILSPDHQRLAVLAGSTVLLLSAVDGTPQFEFNGHEFPVADLTWSPDGRRACSTGIKIYKSRTPEVLVWDTATGKILLRLEGMDVAIKRLAWSPDGKRIATGSQDGWVSIWDAATGELLLRSKGGSRIDSLTWSPDGRQLISGAATEGVRVLSASPGPR